MFELKKSKQYRYFKNPAIKSVPWSTQALPTLIPPRQLFQLYIQKKLVFECFFTTDSVPQSHETLEGLYVLTPCTIFFTSWDCKTTVSRPRHALTTIIHGANGQLFTLTPNAIYHISGCHPRLLNKVCSVSPLKAQFPSEVKLTSAAVYRDFVFLSTWQKMFIVSRETGRVVQSLMIFEGIKEINIECGKLIVSTLESQFEILEFGTSELPTPPKPSPPKLSPDTIISLGRHSSLTLSSPLSLLWEATLSRSPLAYVKSLWRLDPLDRTYLHSKEFYQEHLYAYMSAEVKIAALVLYLEEPGSLRLLREALREQETNLRVDGLLRAEESISSFLLGCLPPVTIEDRPEQTAIRDELGSKARQMEEIVEYSQADN